MLCCDEMIDCFLVKICCLGVCCYYYYCYYYHCYHLCGEIKILITKGDPDRTVLAVIARLEVKTQEQTVKDGRTSSGDMISKKTVQRSLAGDESRLNIKTEVAQCYNVNRKITKICSNLNTLLLGHIHNET